ncbi:hypothetical protein SAMN05421788_1011382 [Filimonas lacunae]|uniref:DUF1360 domain-containing protein n=1 Tax=Filimonas lacunae TaxID=477680 RepID=A0A173MR76_9BACT|nr:hypothetical protein [Filimonas lacunae]BAV09950.1 hypothetical protein FLA_6003 [Filimonas lacunae]SIS81554.1 hypothetical protein SAMN05421788_1011382 [Filimonas lacunae]
MLLHTQIIWLFLLALPVACIAWTITHEEVFLEPRQYCIERSRKSRTLWQRKLFYLFTCEYCFSHYVVIFILLLSDFQLLLTGWRGYIIAGFSLVWIANMYMSLFAWLRTSLKKERTEISIEEKKLEKL